MSEVIEIRQSPLKALGLLAAGVLMTLMCLAIVLGWLDGRPPDAVTLAVCWLGVLFFGLGTAIAAWRLATTGTGPVVTLSPAGIRDIRIAPETIPWAAVRGIGSHRVQGQAFIVLDVDPGAEAQLTLSPAVRWTRGANRAIGVGGLWISANELNTGCAALLAQCQAYWDAAQGRPAP